MLSPTNSFDEKYIDSNNEYSQSGGFLGLFGSDNVSTSTDSSDLARGKNKRKKNPLKSRTTPRKVDSNGSTKPPKSSSPSKSSKSPKSSKPSSPSKSSKSPKSSSPSKSTVSTPPKRQSTSSPTLSPTAKPEFSEKETNTPVPPSTTKTEVKTEVKTEPKVDIKVDPVSKKEVLVMPILQSTPSATPSIPSATPKTTVTTKKEAIVPSKATVSIKKEASPKKPSTRVASSGPVIMTDTSELIKKIENDLDRFKNVDDLSNAPKGDKFVLKVGDKKISRECMLHFLSEKKLYADVGKRRECSNAFDIYYTKEKKINLTGMIKLSDSKDFTKDVAFYQNLSEFSLGLAELINDKKTWSSQKGGQDTATTISTETKVLAEYKLFLQEALIYVLKFMSAYNVTSADIIEINNTLLLLYYSVVRRLADQGKSTDRLQETYDRLKKTTADTINLYEEYQQKAKSQIDSAGGKNADADATYADLIKRLEDRIKKIEAEQNTLKSNIKSVDENISNISQHVENGKAKEIANTLEKGK